jgi:hypothetical protein
MADVHNKTTRSYNKSRLKGKKCQGRGVAVKIADTMQKQNPEDFNVYRKRYGPQEVRLRPESNVLFVDVILETFDAAGISQPTIEINIHF